MAEPSRDSAPGCGFLFFTITLLFHMSPVRVRDSALFKSLSIKDSGHGDELRNFYELELFLIDPANMIIVYKCQIMFFSVALFYSSFFFNLIFWFKFFAQHFQVTVPQTQCPRQYTHTHTLRSHSVFSL